MSWHELVCCPRCAGPLADDGASVRCGDCHRGYPRIGGIPVLLRDAEAEINQWRWRLDDFVRSNLDVRTKLLAELATDAKLASTRRRLESLRQHLAIHERRLADLFAAAGVTPQARGGPDHAAVAGEGTVTAYYHQIHRDWGWEEDGNREAREAAAAIAGVLPAGAELGRMLVLGGGAARLARDVHRAHGARTTIVLDINPLPFLVARRILAGETVQLYEFPVPAPTSDAVFVDRSLASSEPSPDGLHLLFADGLDPPVVDGAFDTVLTPWFIDQVPQDLATLIPEIRAALAVGGRWINSGPLLYQPGHTRLVHRYCHDELFELCKAGGFEIERQSIQRMLYMESPAGTQGRTEQCITFSARKTGDAERPAEPVTPPWLVDTALPVPLLEGLAGYEAPHPLFAAVVALIDGRRSVADIAAVLVAQHGLPREPATAAVQAALKLVAEQLGDRALTPRR